MHSEKHWSQAADTMTPYYEFILREQRDRNLVTEIPTPP
jgi:hypothetical protein